MPDTDIREEARDLSDLEARLGYRFKRRTVLEKALVHSSAPEVVGGKAESYQRLEFLGDRVLGLAVAEMVYSAFPDADEGELSRRLTQLVRKETCAAIAENLELGRFIHLGHGEAQSGGRRKKAILGDVCESVIAAIYLDGGYTEAAQFIQRSWDRLMRESETPLRDAKTALQEWAHRQGFDVPVYREVSRTGPDHKPVFTISVTVGGEERAHGRGQSKRLAEQDAARTVLEAEDVWAKGRNG